MRERMFHIHDAVACKVILYKSGSMSHTVERVCAFVLHAYSLVHSPQKLSGRFSTCMPPPTQEEKLGRDLSRARHVVMQKGNFRVGCASKMFSVMSSVNVGSQVTLATANDSRHPPECIIDG